MVRRREVFSFSRRRTKRMGRGQDSAGAGSGGRESAMWRGVVVSHSRGASHPPGRGRVRRRARERWTRTERGRFRLRGSSRGSAVAVPSDGCAKEREKRRAQGKRGEASAALCRGGLDEGVGTSERRTSLHCALVMSAEPATYPVTLSVYACSCASARGRSSAASATVNTAAAIVPRAISPAGTASRHRPGVGAGWRSGLFLVSQTQTSAFLVYR